MDPAMTFDPKPSAGCAAEGDSLRCVCSGSAAAFFLLTESFPFRCRHMYWVRITSRVSIASENISGKNTSHNFLSFTEKIFLFA